MLPRYDQTAALADILTEHKNQIDALNTALTNHVNDFTTAHNYDARYVRTSDTSERQISGMVNSNGTTAWGTGFTSVREATGFYRITFDLPFAATCRPVITVFDGDHVSGIFASASELGVIIENPIGVPSDETFTFVTFGP